MKFVWLLCFAGGGVVSGVKVSGDSAALRSGKLYDFKNAFHLPTLNPTKQQTALSGKLDKGVQLKTVLTLARINAARQKSQPEGGLSNSQFEVNVQLKQMKTVLMMMFGMLSTLCVFGARVVGGAAVGAVRPLVAVDASLEKEKLAVRQLELEMKLKTFTQDQRNQIRNELRAEIEAKLEAKYNTKHEELHRAMKRFEEERDGFVNHLDELSRKASAQVEDQQITALYDIETKQQLLEERGAQIRREFDQKQQNLRRQQEAIECLRQELVEKEHHINNQQAQIENDRRELLEQQQQVQVGQQNLKEGLEKLRDIEEEFQQRQRQLAEKEQRVTDLQKQVENDRHELEQQQQHLELELQTVQHVKREHENAQQKLHDIDQELQQRQCALDEHQRRLARKQEKYDAIMAKEKERLMEEQWIQEERDRILEESLREAGMI